MKLSVGVMVQRGDFTLCCRLDVHSGRPLVVLGRNGAGKSTLLHAIAGLVPLHYGRVSVDGEVLEDTTTGVWLPPERRDVSLVFQDGRLFPHMSVRDNVAFGLRARGVRRPLALRRADTLLEQLGVAAQGSARPEALSGGQAQRAALARALAVEPAVLLLDEPLHAVDATSQDDVRRVIAAEVARFCGVCILVTHDAADAAALAADSVTLADGRLHGEALPSEV